MKDLADDNFKFDVIITLKKKKNVAVDKACKVVTSTTVNRCGNILKSQTTNFRLFQTLVKNLADDNFKFDENGRKFSKQVENNVGKGEIARDEQFLLFPQCFQKKNLSQTRKNQGLFKKYMHTDIRACEHASRFFRKKRAIASP